MNFAVVGLGAAGSACVARLLELAGPSDEILAVDSSPVPPPSPALWPEYAAGTVDGAAMSASAAWVRWVAAAQTGRPPRLTAVWGKAATVFDPAARRLYLDGGEAAGYDRLMIATGGTAVGTGIPGLFTRPPSGVYCLGSIAMVESLRRDLALRPAGSRIAVVGAGPSGLRLAELLRNRGHEVTLLEAQPLLLPAVASPDASEALSAAALRAGIAVRTGARVLGAMRNPGGRVGGLLYSQDGREAVQRCDLALFCTGFGPRVLPGFRGGAARWARRGLPVGPDMSVRDLDGVYAAGDCARPERGWGCPPGLWQVASWQGSRAALAMAGFDPGPPLSRVVLTVRFFGLLVTAGRPYAPRREADAPGRGRAWDVRVAEAAAAPEPGPPPEVWAVAD